MAKIYNFPTKIFRDITKERVDVVTIASGFMGGVVKVYECEGTVIIHSENKSLAMQVFQMILVRLKNGKLDMQ